MIEVEMRGLFTEPQYAKLKEEFGDKMVFAKKFRRVNILYGDYDAEGRIDLRCRITNDYAEIVLKIGELSSSDREEIEVKIEKNQFINAVKLLAVLGHQKCLVTIRDSERYVYKGIEFTFVRALKQGADAYDSNTVYYEAELMEEDKDKVGPSKAKILGAIKELGLTVLKDHSGDVDESGADSGIISENTFYNLVKELNTKVDIHVDASTPEGIKVIEESLNALG